MIGFVNGLALIIALSQVKSFKVDEDDDDDDGGEDDTQNQMEMDDQGTPTTMQRRRLLAGGFEVFYDDEVCKQLKCGSCRMKSKNKKGKRKKKVPSFSSCW